MNRRSYLGGAACVLAVFVLLTCCGPVRAELIVDGGFEAGTPELSLPDVFLIWAGDRTATVPAMSGITPAEGVRMLQFINTSWTQQGASGATSSDLWQLVDAAPLRGQNLLLSARFNRVQVDAQTDTRFALNIYAFTGAPASFDNNDPNLPASIGHENAQLLSDADPATWETVAIDFAVPANADYLGVSVSAAENIHNDSSGTELDGHFADAVELGVDCNGNGVFDAVEIAGHPSLDWNGDGVIDNCQQGMGVVGAPSANSGRDRVTLCGASPNPFNPVTTLAFDLPRPMVVSLRVYDVSGRLVAGLLDGETARQGRNEVAWRGRDAAGRAVPSGVYFYRLEAEGNAAVGRMTLLE
ncbi:MAG: FlgD immunoglobulin-like domain containing protein [Candidatus Latescibacteria bacterium]|nr:FlgD immunoglobulin-like domain containing protein [Candidatus Latescibacterota bacterium]